MAATQGFNLAVNALGVFGGPGQIVGLHLYGALGSAAGGVCQGEDSGPRFDGGSSLFAGVFVDTFVDISKTKEYRLVQIIAKSKKMS
jgi:hypothetical protein